MTLKNKFDDWIGGINKVECIATDVIAFNFGLFKTTDGYSMYLIGSKTYDENDEDWATNVDFEPKEKYLHFESTLVKGKEWQEVLKITEDLIAKYVQSESFQNSIFKDAKAITTGFDDGNLTRIK